MALAQPRPRPGQRDRLSPPRAKGKAAPKAPSAAPKPRARRTQEVSTQTDVPEPPRLPSLLLRPTMSSKSNPLNDDDGSPMPLQLRVSRRASLSSKTNPLDGDESPMPMTLQVQKIESGTSGSEATPQVPEERSQWELASLDPSSWPIFGITSEGFAGIGVSKDGLIHDGEKSLHFALDQAALASITEGDASFNSVQFASGNVAGSLQEALSQAHEQNQSLRELCWDMIHLAGDLEGKETAFEPQDHEQLLFEARRSLHVIHSRLEQALEPEEAAAAPTAGAAAEATPEDPSPAEPEVDVEVSADPGVQDASEEQKELPDKVLTELADKGIFEGTPEITPQPGPFTQPEVTAGPTLLVAREAHRQSCQFVSPVQRRMSQPAIVFSPALRTTRSLVCPSVSSLSRSVTCPVRQSPTYTSSTRAQSPLQMQTARGNSPPLVPGARGTSILAPAARFVSGDRRPFCEPVTRAISPLHEAPSPAPAWKWQASGMPTPAGWPRPAAQSSRPCWVLTRST